MVEIIVGAIISGLCVIFAAMIGIRAKSSDVDQKIPIDIPSKPPQTPSKPPQTPSKPPQTPSKPPEYIEPDIINRNGILNPDDYPYGSKEYYKALFQRTSLLKNNGTMIFYKEDKK